MSQQINEVFSKYKKVFKAKDEEIREYLFSYFEKAFLSQKVINVERIDATDRIKLAGFNKDISSWRNHYKNIIVSTCIADNGVQKRYDYKFFFTKEKLNEATIEIIENALEESTRLKRQFQFDDAITKIDEMLELIQKKNDEIFNKILNDARSELITAKEKHDKAMEQISKLEEKIKINKKIGNLKAVIKDCEKLVELASSITRGDIARKYRDILTKTQNEIETRKAQEAEKSEEEKKALEEKRAKERYDRTMEQIAELEENIKKDRNNGNLKSVLNNCEKIIDISNLINRNDLAEKYTGILEDTKKEIEAQKAQEKEKTLEEKQALKEKKAQEKEKALEEKHALKEKKAIEKAKALAEKQSLKEQKALEKAKALAEKKALKEQKAQEKAKVLEEKKALKEKMTQEKYDKAMEQIAKLEEAVKNNQENDNLPAVVSDCEKIINLANSINREDLVEKYTGILEDARKELEARNAQENAKTIAEKKALKEKKAQEKAKALAEKQALKEQKAQEKAKALEEKKALDEKKSQEQYDKILEQIAKLEENVKTNQENDNLPAVVSDCEKIINLANSINKEDLVEKYRGILEDARKELEARNAQENAKTIAEKQALKEKNAQEKAKVLEEKNALKEKKAQEKEKRLAEKNATREEKDREGYERLLEQISKFEEDIKDYQETNDLTSIAIACEKIIRIAKLIKRNDIAKKYSTLLKKTKKEMLSQIKSKSITEKEPLKEKKAQERKKRLAEKNALREEKALKKKEALEKKEALKDNKVQEKEKALAEKKALREQEKNDFALKRISILEEIIENNLKNDNLKAVIRDSEKIIELANLVNREDLKEKYSAILASSMQEVEARKANRRNKTSEEKQALKEQKAQEKAKVLEEKKALREQKAQEKHDKIQEQIVKLEENVKTNQENDNLQAIVSDCEKIINLANSINKQDLVEKYTGILEDARKELEARKAQENAKTIAEKQALKQKKAQEKAKALAEKQALKEQKAQEKPKALEEKQALKEQKAQEKAKALAEKQALKEQKAQEKFNKILEQIAKLEEGIKINQENDNLPAVVSDCEKIIKLANSVNREDLKEKYSAILEDAKRELEARNAQEKQENALKRISTLEENVKINREIENLKAIISDYQKIIKIAESINRDDIVRNYSGPLDDTKREIKNQRAREKAKVSEEKIASKEKVRNKPLMILSIIGGLLMIINGIANIILLFNMIYSNIIPIIGIETADTFFIFLYVNGCICIIGGILVIFGSLEVISNHFKPGKSLISFGLTMDLIGSMMLLTVGLWAGTLCGSFATFIINSIWLYFGISVVAILFTIVSLIKIEEKEEEIPKTYYTGFKKDKVIEKKAISN